MNSNKPDREKMLRGLSDILLEASEEELREALRDAEEGFDQLAAQGQAAAARALELSEDPMEAADLHRGLAALIQTLRRLEGETVEETADKAKIDAEELMCIESDPFFDPQPRTIYQLEQHFNLQPRSLVLLSGAIHVETDVRDEAVRYAASAKNMTSLSREEKKSLNRFIKFLREHTDS